MEKQNLCYVEEEELAKLRRDSALLSIMRSIGVDNKYEYNQYWPGMEQAYAMLSDMYED